jgi:hypothetical protein
VLAVVAVSGRLLLTVAMEALRRFLQLLQLGVEVGVLLDSVQEKLEVLEVVDLLEVAQERLIKVLLVDQEVILRLTMVIVGVGVQVQ